MWKRLCLSRVLVCISMVLSVLLISCGKDGVNGRDGLPGAKGEQGDVNPSCQEGTKIIPIQFCKDQDRPTRKARFSEYGLCIDNKLYAIYWNKRWLQLVEIVPGEYTSSATGLKCSFIVEENCVIQ